MLLSQVSVPIDFPSNLKGDVPFHQAAFDYHRAEWNGLGDNLRDFPWEVFFKFGASAVASKFLEWAQVDIKPHSSTWFQLFVLLPNLMEITSFVCTSKTHLL